VNIPLQPREVVTGIGESRKVETIEAPEAEERLTLEQYLAAVRHGIKPFSPIAHDIEALWALVGVVVVGKRQRNGLWSRINPHTGRPNRGKRQPAGTKLARGAHEQSLTVCRVH